MEHDTPEGYTLRPATLEDASAIAELINQVTLAEIGRPWTTSDQVRDLLTSPGADPALADLVLVGDDGVVAGLIQFLATTEPLEVQMLVFVPPRLWGTGVSTSLLRLGEARARAAAGSEGGVVRVSRFARNDAASRIFASLGYAYVRTFWVMQLELGGPQPRPEIPEGIVIRTFDPEGDMAATYAALAETFADHWGGFPSFDEWRHEEIEGEGSDFDASLWYVAEAGEDIVGLALSRATSPRAEGTAQVLELGVRRPWRRRGIALALLHTAFAELHRRGIPRVELSVDADSPTGATHLYERAGMREAYSWEVWEKPLR